MWAFYKTVARMAIKELWNAFNDVFALIALLLFVAILFNKQFGQWLMSTWNGISPWWSTIPIGLLLAYRLLQANYQKFTSMQGERDEAVGKLQLVKPFVSPREYRKHNGESGLVITNPKYAAYDVQIPLC